MSTIKAVKLHKQNKLPLWPAMSAHDATVPRYASYTSPSTIQKRSGCRRLNGWKNNAAKM